VKINPGHDARQIGDADHRKIDATRQHGNHHGDGEDAELRHDVADGFKVVIAQELVRVHPGHQRKDQHGDDDELDDIAVSAKDAAHVERLFHVACLLRRCFCGHAMR